MKIIPLLIITMFLLVACDKTYICNCAYESGGLPYKKVYLNAKSDNGAERKCTKIEEGGESCSLQ